MLSFDVVVEAKFEVPSASRVTVSCNPIWREGQTACAGGELPQTAPRGRRWHERMAARGLTIFVQSHEYHMLLRRRDVGSCRARAAQPLAGVPIAATRVRRAPSLCRRLRSPASMSSVATAAALAPVVARVPIVAPPLTVALVRVAAASQLPVRRACAASQYLLQPVHLHPWRHQFN